MRGQKTRWERFEFDREAAIASVAPIGLVASGFAGGSGYASWAISSGASSGGVSQAFNWPASLEQSVSSLSATSAPAKVEANDPATENTGPIQNSSHEVDEPGNWSLMAIGLLMLLFWRQKQLAYRAR